MARSKQTNLGAVLLDFARVLVEGKGQIEEDKVSPLPDVSLEAPALDERLQIALTVWNAVVFEQWGRGDGFVKDARFSIAAMGQPTAMNIFESLVQRKKGPFAADKRAILKVSVKALPDGRLWVRAKEKKR